MPIYGTSFLDGEDQTYAGVKEVESVLFQGMLITTETIVVMERQYCENLVIARVNDILVFFSSSMPVEL